jgi:hypothetical protein
LTHADDEVQGDGPVGGITACATACLPYLLRQPSHSRDSIELFLSIANAVQESCASPARNARGLSYKALYTLHEAVMEVLSGERSLGNELEVNVVNHFFQVSHSYAVFGRLRVWMVYLISNPLLPPTEFYESCNTVLLPTELFSKARRKRG